MVQCSSELLTAAQKRNNKGDGDVHLFTEGSTLSLRHHSRHFSQHSALMRCEMELAFSPCRELGWVHVWLALNINIDVLQSQLVILQSIYS